MVKRAWVGLVSLDARGRPFDDALAPLDPRFIFTRVDDPKAFSPDALAAAWRAVSGQPSLTAPTAREALTMAYADPMVVAGSLYLVGEVRGILTGTTEAS